jgi:5'-nucleotidase
LFRFLSASTFAEDGSTLFPATGLRSFGSGARRVTVGFVGLTLKETPSLVSPDGVKGLTFGDEAEAINAAVPRLKQQGADAIVVLIHQGGKSSGTPDPNGCEGLSGEILPILSRTDPRVDVVVSGHTHAAYVCDFGKTDPARPFLLTSAGLYGQLVTDITLSIDPVGKRVVAKRAANAIVQSPGYTSARGAVANTKLYPRFEPRADIAAYVQRYTDAAREFAERPAGRVYGSAGRPSPHTPGGGPLGNLIADAQLSATRSAGAQIALTNPFGIRAGLEPSTDGAVTFGQLYNVQPFGNELITQSMTGAEIRAVLEQGLDGEGPEQILAASAGFTWRYDRSRPVGQRVLSVTLNGEELRDDATYRVTTNSFLAGGGDGFTLFARQRDGSRGMTDLDALAAWVQGPAPRAIPLEERATGAAR